jgi:FkbM family methyltransferase
MNKNKLYTFLYLITPPFLFKILKESSFYPFIKKNVLLLIKKEKKPEFILIEKGLLKGVTIFTTKESAVENMFIQNHDSFMFDYIKEGSTILDIGAHIGSNTLSFATLVKDTGKIYAFEPNPFNLEILEKNLEKNTDLKNRIIPVNLALSNQEGEEEFIFTDNIYNGTSSGSFIDSADTIWPKEDYEQKSGFKRMKIKTDTLDNFIKINTIKPDILKIDVEGAENLVLEGAKNTLVHYSPIILIEVHSIFNMFKTFEILSKNHYKFELINKEKDGRCFFVCQKII